MKYRVTSGVASAISGRSAGRLSASSSAPKIIRNAGGRTNSSIVVFRLVRRKPRLDVVVVDRALQCEAQQLGEYHHDHAGQEAVDRVEADPLIDPEISMDVHRDLCDNGRDQDGAEDPPQDPDGLRADQPVIGVVRTALGLLVHFGTSRMRASMSTTGPLNTKNRIVSAAVSESAATIGHGASACSRAGATSSGLKKARNTIGRK